MPSNWCVRFQSRDTGGLGEGLCPSLQFTSTPPAHSWWTRSLGKNSMVTMKIASRKVHYFPFPTRFLPWKRGFTERLRGAPRSPVVRSRASLVGARDRCLCLWGRGVSSLPFLCLSTLQPSFSAKPVVCLPQSPTEPMAGVPSHCPWLWRAHHTLRPDPLSRRRTSQDRSDSLL